MSANSKKETPVMKTRTEKPLSRFEDAYRGLIFGSFFLVPIVGLPVLYHFFPSWCIPT